MILAGGLGTRLGDIASNLPKAMVPVAGVPFIAHQMELLVRERVKEVVLCLAHMSEQIEEFVGDGSRFGLNVQYSYDGEEHLGTGGAILKALPLVAREFAVLYGDTFLDIDFSAVEQSFQKSGKSALMTVLENRGRWDKSNVLFRDGTIEAYDKQTTSQNFKHIDFGLILFRSDAFIQAASLRSSQTQSFDLTSIFAHLIANRQLGGHEVSNRFYEIGTPQALAETDEYLRRFNQSITKQPS
jgi:NDP-sugar pyrophosphorylase family protein